ncbi:MAG: hypothetical protein IPP93_03775 [Chitinophagaceae bacterium]|nr:hypothetical protein [Chitinophagaceae bacterium]
MKKIYLYLISGTVLFTACTREIDGITPPPVQEKACTAQTANPVGRSYSSDSVVTYPCTDNHCGILPLSTRNYWVYLDSFFINGEFSRMQYDTLRYTETYKSLSDGLIWWKSNMSVGLPATLYANDSAFFMMDDRMFNREIKDVHRDYAIGSVDSVRYLSSFDDIAAFAKSVRKTESISTPAGNFDQYYYFEKSAPRVRRDQVYFKPGLGVVKYVIEQAAPGTYVTKVQQISTLVKFHID